MVKDRQAEGCAVAIGIVGAIYLLAKCVGGPQEAPVASQATTTSPALAAELNEKAKVCEKALGTLAADGLIRDRPETNRADVEDLMWAQLAAKDKRMVAAAVRCAMRPAPEDYAVIYGYRSGQRLAMAMATGVSIEGAN